MLSIIHIAGSPCILLINFLLSLLFFFFFSLVSLHSAPHPFPDFYDSVTIPQRASTLITVRITDINDNSPVWDQAAYTFSIRENEQAGTPVGVPLQVSWGLSYVNNKLMSDKRTKQNIIINSKGISILMKILGFYQMMLKVTFLLY